jgi:hypothetical protein
LFKNIETLKFAEFRHFWKMGQETSFSRSRELRMLLITPPFFVFFAKKQRKKLAKKWAFTKFEAQFRRVPLPMLSDVTEVIGTS